MFSDRFRLQEERVSARHEEREKRERGFSSARVVGFFYQRRYQPRRQRMRLHMVHAYKRNLPGNGETFGRVQAGREAGSHTGSARDGDQVWFALQEPCFAGLGGVSLNWDGVQGIVAIAGWGCIRKVLEGGGDKGGEILLVRFKRR